MSLRETDRLTTATLTYPIDVEDAAEAAGLRYVNDNAPGFTRRRVGQGFLYLDADGDKIKDERILERIRALRIPPAWNQVWICRRTDGHLQCTGRDEKGRKQYIYHSRWHEIRNRTKFDKLLLFSQKLPIIRRRVQNDLKRQGLCRERVLATIVSIMEKTLIRVGNEEYARENHSYGLTTLRTRHVNVKGSRLRFRFRGKHGKEHDIEIDDPRLAKVVRRCQELPGQELFSYENELGELTPVDSGDVNSYLREISGQDFTAKDFRTWGGSVIAARFLTKHGPCPSDKKRKSAILRAIEHTASHLGNTVAVCRKYYVHPSVVESFMTGALFAPDRSSGQSSGRPKRKMKRPARLRAEELFLVELLKRTCDPAVERALLKLTS